MTMQPNGWRDGVTIARAAAQASARMAMGGRATAFDLLDTGGSNRTWVGTVTLQLDGDTGGHHHGRHEVAIFVAKGRSQIRWGDQLEFAAEVGPGDLVYFAPYVPHQEINLDHSEAAEFVVIRSDNEAILVRLDIAPVEHPEVLF